MMTAASLQEEINKLKKENIVLKAVLTSVVSKNIEKFKPEELCIEVGDNDVVIQGERAGGGSSKEGFTCVQFNWRFPLNEMANAENRNNEFYLQESNNETLQCFNNVPGQELNKAPVQEFNNGTAQRSNNKSELQCNIAPASLIEQEPNRNLSKQYKIYIKSDSGEKRALDVESTDTIKRVKSKIQEQFGCDTDKQVLRHLNSGLMEDGKTVFDYFIENNSEVFLSMMTQTNIQICIRTLIGESFEIEIDSTKSLGDLKLIIEKSTGIPVDRQRLVFAGKQLGNSTTLYDNNVENGSTIHLL